MKTLPIILLSFFLASCFSLHAEGPPELYARTIYIDKIEDAEFQQSLDDLTIYLKKITGQEFTIKQVSNEADAGIYLLWNKQGLLPPGLYKKLSTGSIEDFVVSGNRKQLLLIANHPTGFSRSIYTYLDLLGVKWYFPGTDWEFIPSKNDITFLSTQYFTPSFNQRNFFGTGSIRANSVLDPNSTVMKEWNDWKRRNRMGGEINPGGHYGEIFNYKHKKELEEHPEYLALVHGKRVEWNATAKWCISNKDFRKLFIADRIEELKTALTKRKYPSEKIVLSVDPADGGDDCECEFCKKIGSVSDRAYLLANEVAREFSKISSMAFANIYAYNVHAAPPAFSLEPNLIVQVIPYAFQNVGTPEQMIELWKKRHNNLMIYDYYAIPDWHYEIPMPRKTSPDTLLKKLAYWKKKGIKGFMLESVFGFGSAGPGLYLMGRVGWDQNTNITLTRQEFYKNMFGLAADKLQQYFEYIGNNYQGNSDLPHLLNLLDEASKNANPVAANRIIQLQAYLHYIILFQQWQSAAPNNQQTAWSDLIQYVWEIYPLKIIHSTRIAELFYYGLDANSPLRKDWIFVEPFGEKLKEIKFIDNKEIRGLTRDDETKYPVLEGFVYGKSKPLSYFIKKTSGPEPGNSKDLLFLNFPDSYIRAAASGSFEFFIRLNAEPSDKNLTYPVTITCIDTVTGASIVTRKEEVGYVWKKISIKLPQGKPYKLTLNFQPWVLIRIPNDQWIGFSAIPTYAVMSQLWFYVPTAAKYLYYSNSAKEQPVFTDAEGNKIIPQRVNDLNLFRLDTKMKGGEWWNMTSAEYKFLQFYSVPDLFFTHLGYSVTGSRKD